MKIIQIAEALTMYILLLKSNSCLAHGATLPRIFSNQFININNGADTAQTGQHESNN